MPTAETLDPDHSRWHWLAVDLRVWRLERNLSQADVARILKIDTSTVSNYESARAKIPKHHTETLDERWRTRGHFTRLRRLAENSHNPDWGRQHAEYEDSSSLIRTFESSTVPGLLQTEEYARSCFTAAGVEDVDHAWARRAARQQLLSRADSPKVSAILDQAVISRTAGGARIMKVQLARLVEFSLSPMGLLRVVPWSAGAYIGQDGSFKIMHRARSNDAVVYIEAQEGGRLINDPTKIREFDVRWERVSSCALSLSTSRQLIIDTMESLNE
ncbi:helix-turn-helix domain-containing protein [Actinomadura parmotrematis]|uniref:Helix-turn-helix transcriptional regulator n=1 Tax=Actinomadura parmotrematis TaxID=2864039 RepID=A0ABS7G0P2_9ACTN|nr:helix-turn-helix transcriptional regulator [Actinomadura parmotrematis]MBW8485775.1 helix-turn-helix transcriptional regulator [Actinomadura parmotrematis]